ncbi:Hypothetical protein NTJ_05594 [Nesidiocoris tenuis]|uniref:endo-polygalacturonase n=1 Tax=Nesidiocoris tenuis TaxID=355587 RepID=A0ABN7AKL2_9HEMI|nr:Hypothetical protein NTJ_05594 [Nesidiocoris tenuis]
MEFARILSLCLFVYFAEAKRIVVSDIKQLPDAKANSNHIVLKDVFVPAGVSLDLTNLKPGTHVEFHGKTRFGYKEWKGPLIKVNGNNIKIKGGQGHSIDCEGARWWDTLGGNGGKTKPLFFHAALSNSNIARLNVTNTPCHGFAINGKNIHISHVRMDNKLGHTKGGHNTDGFDVANAENVKIDHCYVDNQDDCLALNSGVNITFVHNTCIGGHGISIVPWGHPRDVVQNVVIKHCQVINADVGVRVKTCKDANGLVKNVIYDDILLKNIAKQGIVVIGNYLNSGPRGEPTDGVPIQGLTIHNVRGNVLPGGTNVEINIHDKVATNWKWSKINVFGGKRTVQCKGVPSNLKIACGQK